MEKEEKITKKRNKKIFKIVINTFRTIFFILLISFILLVCMQRFSNNRISFFNYRMFTVITGSMEPRYSVGDVLISKWVEPSKIKEGDTVSYLGKSGGFADKVITHEVKEIEITDEKKYRFHTKGLTNLVEDPIVNEDQLYGKVICKVTILSFIYRMVSNGVGFYLFIVIPLFLIIGYEFLSALLSKEAERRKK